MRPLVGITGRRLSASLTQGMDKRFAGRHVDSFFSDYARCVADAGGIPVHLPFEAGTAEAVERLDGLIITGGQDVHPGRWGGDESALPADADPRCSTMAHDVERDAYEAALIHAAVDRGVPVLGVCRGHQLLNVALGGRLVPDLPASEVEHYSLNEALTDGDPDHVVTFTPGSLAASVYGANRQVNSWHHQAVNVLGGGLVVSGRAADGVVESIELPDRPVLGIQWHPEWQATTDPAFAWLTAAASGTHRPAGPSAAR
ncbi:gamma-glutamyl-gamma-aminobutyrate hydrolase family protein [Streptomyces sp. NPDC058469]|uniref:gamma-glutamyl-gamma-aminobutyrate hydrolase family protein n=1 Tax=Streptomyces sp. NPDC058469 TaxID=3346514 RepID=UPI0036585A28